MKKYDVFSLYVVETGSSDNTYLLICKRDFNDINKYREIFTKELLENVDNSKVSPLSDYYSLLAVCNWKTMETLKLSEKELLRKYIKINSTFKAEDRNAELKKIEKIIRLLTKLLIVFFIKKQDCSCFYYLIVVK